MNDDTDSITSNANYDQLTNVDNSLKLAINTSDDEKSTEQCSHVPVTNTDINTPIGVQSRRSN